MTKVYHEEITLKLSEIIPYKSNPRINDDAVGPLAESMMLSGYDQYILVDEDNVILKGHTRLKALSLLRDRGDLGKGKLSEVNADAVKVIKVYGLTEKEKKTARITDNKVAELADWNMDLLAIELDDIGMDMGDLGFGDDDPDDPIDIIEDDYEEPEVLPPKVKRGQIWKLGDHVLMCGDATLSEDVQKVVNAGGGRVDMVFTDPPYGMCLDTDFSPMKGFGVGNKYDAVIGDNLDFTPALINTVFNNFPHTKEIFLWGADYYAELIPNRNVGSWVVWDKMQNGEGCNDSHDKMFGSNFELCWSKQRHKRALARILWKGFFGISAEDTKSRVHPTQKPVNLIKWFFDKFKGEVIADIYGGSGSTLIACEQTNRKCIMMEIDEHYCDVIIDRWQNLTGKTAELIEG